MVPTTHDLSANDSSNANGSKHELAMIGGFRAVYPRVVRGCAARRGGWVVAGWKGNSSFAKRAGKAVEPREFSAPAPPPSPPPTPVTAEEEKAAPASLPPSPLTTSTQQQQQQQDESKEGVGEGKEGAGEGKNTLDDGLGEVLQEEHREEKRAGGYVHHFDSYSLVKQLQEGGWTEEQAITAMKGIRGLLARNLDVAQETLVSKSDVENESYLFSAACSELRAEIKNNRRIQDEQMRQQRTHLQHEVDILTQSMNQELQTLSDTVRGLFNDRRMAVREEQKTAESAIQQISYKMSIMLSSDSKSEIEGLRWILIRRSVVGIIFMAILTLGTIRYATYVRRERQKEERLIHG